MIEVLWAWIASVWSRAGTATTGAIRMRIGTIENSLCVPATCTRTGCWVGPTFGPSPAASLDSTTTLSPSAILPADDPRVLPDAGHISNGQTCRSSPSDLRGGRDREQPLLCPQPGERVLRLAIAHDHGQEDRRQQQRAERGEIDLPEQTHRAGDSGPCGRKKQRARHLFAVQVADAGNAPLFTPREHSDPGQPAPHRLRDQVSMSAGCRADLLQGAAAVENRPAIGSTEPAPFLAWRGSRREAVEQMFQLLHPGRVGRRPGFDPTRIEPGSFF